MNLNVAFLLIVSVVNSLGAQTPTVYLIDGKKSAELVNIENRLVNSVQNKLPDWTHEAIEPMKGSVEVGIHHWKLNEKVVAVTIIRFSSVSEAQQSIRSFAANKKGTAEPPYAGEEQYSFPYHRILFRKRQLTVYIDARLNVADDVGDADEERQLFLQFASYVSDAIGDN